MLTGLLGSAAAACRCYVVAAGLNNAEFQAWLKQAVITGGRELITTLL